VQSDHERILSPATDIIDLVVAGSSARSPCTDLDLRSSTILALLQDIIAERELCPLDGHFARAGCLSVCGCFWAYPWFFLDPRAAGSTRSPSRQCDGHSPRVVGFVSDGLIGTQTDRV
jgi:hypothetical protein